MKKILLSLCLLSVCALHSQQLEIFNFNKVVNLTSATVLQQDKFKLAISKRESALKEDILKSKESILAINKKFITNINKIFKKKQLEKFYVSQVDLEYVDLIASEKFERLILKFDFPKDYIPELQKKIFNFEFKKQLAEKRNFFDDKASKSAGIKIDKRLNSWRNRRVSFIEKAELDWGRTSSRYELPEKYRTTFVPYNFYTKLRKIDSSTIINSRLKKLQTSNEVKQIILLISKAETEFVKNKCTVIQKFEESEILFATEKLQNYLSGFLHRKLNRDLSIALKRNTEKNCNYLIKKISGKKETNDSLVRSRRKIKFIKKAKEIGIDSLKAINILHLIQKRKIALKSLKKQQQKADEMSELFESTNTKTRTEIKREFSKNLAELINRKQFTSLFRNIFEKNISKQTQARLSDLKENYKLNKKQAKKIEEFISAFYLNTIATSEYYAYDSKLKKQKMSAIRYTYDKKFTILLDDLGLKRKPSAKANNRTFLWGK